MKFSRLPLLASLFLGLCAHAGEQANVPLNMKCISNPATTSFVANTEGNMVRLTVVHHNGVSYMPIFNGPITPSDLPMLQQRAELMQKLGDRIEIEFDKANCKKYGPGLYSCGLGKVVGNSGVKVDRASLLTKTGAERLYDVEFEKNIVSVGFHIEGRYYSTENEFYAGFNPCQFE